MKNNVKFLSIVVLTQVVTALLVFTLTRAYYQEETSTASTSDEPLPSIHPVNSSPQMMGGFPSFPETRARQTLVMPTSNNPEEVNQQAHEAFNNHNYETAAKLYQRVTELSPGSVETYNNLGLTLHYIDRSTEAIKALKNGIDLDSDFQRIWLTLGFVKSSVKNHPEAKQALQRAIELGPETAQGKSAMEMLNKLP